MALHEEDPPQIRARKVKSHAAERARLDPDSRRNFYQMASHVVARMGRGARAPGLRRSLRAWREVTMTRL